MRTTLLFAFLAASLALSGGCSTGGGPVGAEGAFAVALDGANNHFGTVVLDDGSTVFGGDGHDQVAFGQVGGPDVVETFPSDGGFFLVCYDDAGALLWSKPLPDSVQLEGITRAPDGTFGVLCRIYETATIDGQTVDVGQENDGVLVLRYTAGGALLSIKVIAAGDVQAIRFAYAPDGSLLVAVRMQQRTVIDPQGPGDSHTVQPGSDRIAAIVRYEPTGARAWVSRSSSSSVWFSALAVTDAGDCVGVVTVGGAGSSVLDSNLDRGAGIEVFEEGAAIFLLRAADGSVAWTDFFGGPIDADHVRTRGGSIVLTGSIIGTVTFGRSTTVVGGQPRAGFVALYDTLEGFEWVRTIRDPVADVGVRCACIRAGGTFVVTGNGGLATSFEDGPQGVDAPTFVAAYRFSSFEWLLTLETDGIALIDECRILPDGMMLIKGSHEGEVTFPGGTRVPAPTAGEGNFVARIPLPE